MLTKYGNVCLYLKKFKCCHSPQDVMGAVLIFYMQSMIRVHSTGSNVTLLDMV